MEMKSHESSSSSSSSCSRSSKSSSGRNDYEVFLSFRGPDTRAGFTDFLYHSLRDAGVHVFRDDEELRVGEEISTNLTEAINNSKISIPILSVNYASSKWCLEELVRIAESKKTGNQIVMPIFYNVAPFDVRHQTGSFEESFRLHECRFSKETVGKWKETLKEVGSLKGWDLTTGRQSEGEIIKKVVNMVLRQLKKSYMVVTDFVVGVENHVEKIKRMISVDSRGVKIIGIHGMGGIGKSTLAKIIYNQLSHDYEGCSFLANVRETSKLNDTGIMGLQKQLISEILKSEVFQLHVVDEGITTIKERLFEKRVLICLDDVSNRYQLRALVGDNSWFGTGSMIIITTRNKDLLNELVVANSIYEVTQMDLNHSLKLFSRHAFRRDYPPDEFVTYSEKVVKLTGGLPLALEVIGSLLHGKPKDSWEARLKKLEKVPPKEVEENLMISYEELDTRQKSIFLDVACFFVGFDKTILLHFWDSNLCPEEGMEVLEHMSLLKIKEDNSVWMHDQVIDYAKSIICEKGNLKQENRSRLCDHAEAFSILKKAKKVEIVEAMFVSFKILSECGFRRKLFASVPYLTFLQVDGAPRYYDYPFLDKLCIGWRTWTKRIVLPKLRWLSWHHFNPLLSRIKLSASKLVFLDLSHSEVTHKWEGWSQIKAATNLKVLNLSSCHRLTRTPSFSTHLPLERLILSYCSRLLKLDKSIGQLKRLFFLDLTSCHRLHELPGEMGHLESLVELVLDHSGVIVLPDSVGNLKSLKILSLDNSTKIKLPTTVGRTENLEEIYASSENCPSLRESPAEIRRLASVKTLKIKAPFFHVYVIPKLPDSLIRLHLHFQENESENEVPDLSNLVNLRELDLRLYYHKETSCLWWIEKLSKLESLTLKAHGITHLSGSNDFGSLSLLKGLHLKDCHRLQSLPRLPSSLFDISIENCLAMEAGIDISNLNMLQKLKVSSCTITELRGLPPSLIELHLQGCKSLKTFGDISKLKMLSELRVITCAVKEIQGLNCLEKLQILELEDLGSLERLPADLGRLCHIKQLKLPYFPRLQGLPRLPSSLESLLIERCEFANTCIDISNLKRLSKFLVTESTLKEIRGLKDLENLQFLRLEGVYELERLPDLDFLYKLKELILVNCWHLLDLPRLPPNLVELDIWRCPIKMLDVSNSTELKDLMVMKCPIEEIRGLHCLVNLSYCLFNGYSYLDPEPQFLQRTFREEPFYLTTTIDQMK